MRYALYFTPAQDHPLTEAARRWLGRDPFDGSSSEIAAVPGFSSEELLRLTEDPRRYGFHATLKAPFELAPGRSESELLAALREFSVGFAPFEIPAMTLGVLGPFFALVPAAESASLRALADEVVRRFEPFRAPLSPADIARRDPDKLSERGRHHLLEFGYPYVFEDFQFHMTLTGKVPAEQRLAMRAVLEQLFADFIGQPLRIDAIALFVEPERGAAFGAHSLLLLGGSLPVKDILT